MGVQTIVPNLWFDTQAEEAAKYWVEIFSGRIGASSHPKSEVLTVTHYPQDVGKKRAGEVLTVEFQIEGQRFTAINGGPEFTFDEAVSFQVNCESQEEIDELWDELTADGGEPGPCGWLKDKYGLSWQIVPKEIETMLASDDVAAKQRMMQALMHMTKLDAAALKRAFEGK